MSIEIEKTRIKDPEIIFKNFSKIVTEAIMEIEEKYGASYEEIIAYLKNNEAVIFNEIETNYKVVDSDIYRKHRKEILSTDELDMWEQDLNNWYLSIEKGLKKFIEFKKTLIN